MARQYGAVVHRYWQHILVAVLFCVIGSLVLTHSHAASEFLAIEPESGVLTAPATKAADTAASGGSSVLFGSSVPTGGALSIRISGNHFVDQNGATVQLRGVNRSGTQFACAEGYGFIDGPSDDASLQVIKSWGVNAIRVNGNEDCWLGINGVNSAYSGAKYQAFLGDYIKRINALGMYVIFDLHHSAPGTNLALAQEAMADRDHSPAYWSSVGAYFKSYPGVLFDLYNEPYPDSNHNTTAAWVCVRDGGTCPGVTFTAAGMQEMLTAVRTAGADNPVLIAGPQYAGVVDKWTTYKPVDPANQLAASIHIYYNTIDSPEWAPCYIQSCWTNTMAPLATTTPIVIGEVGEHDCASQLIDGTKMKIVQPSLLDWSDQHGISYLGWAWYTGNCAAEPALISNYDGTPTNYGLGIKTHLQSIR